MTDNKPEIPQEGPPKRRTSPLFAIAFFYLMGFLAIRSDYDTSSASGIIIFTIGWLFILLSLVLAVLALFRLFKENFKRKGNNNGR